MESSLALVPGAAASTRSTISLSNTSNAHGLHDSLRHGGARSIAAEVSIKHPLEARLDNWEQTRENLHMTLERNMYGLHAPVRQMMERQLVSQTPTPLHLGGFSKASNLGLDILMGKDEEISPQDVLVDRVETSQLGDFHLAMEHKLRLP
ncbi:Ump1p [Sporobolomyces koalae]|uniref:Ump1p n=1 Tax=Sporobolomyces koalae TaxID=500713 RepID=UPI003180C3AD